MDTLKMGNDKKNVTPPLDKVNTKCYTNIVKGMRLQVDSPMLAKGSNPVMDASKIPLDKIN